MAKLVYSFGTGKTAGHAGMGDLLGGKGANLAEMSQLGVPVPPGFTISTHACNLYRRRRRMPTELKAEVARGLKRLERAKKCKFGDAANPLLVSVRSGAKFSMPGMMDTILNLGLNDRAVLGLAEVSGDRRFAFDSYRRFIQMYADVVLGVSKHEFEALLAAAKEARGLTLDTQLTAPELERLTDQYKRLVQKKTKKPFPQRPVDQLWGAIAAVFDSWDNQRARVYRRQYGIADDLGTAVNVQCMVFGNLGDDCATGVAFTRNPATGANELYGEFLQNAQGEDVVAGIRTPCPITAERASRGQSSLERTMPAAYRELSKIARRLERHYKDMQDLEFTIERGVLYMLQTRTGKRTGQAALNIAFDLHESRLINRKELLSRIDPQMVGQLLAREFDPKDVSRARSDERELAVGLPAGPGAASGKVVFDAERAQELAARGEPVLLVRNETSPEDIGGMLVAEGIVTSRGGMTSHAAVVARGMGKPCVVGAEELDIHEREGRLIAAGQTLREGASLSIDGSTGHVFAGKIEARPSEIQRVLVEKSLPAKKSPLFRRFRQLLEWADKVRRLKVRTNADTPADASVARAFGAEGIGLCRTEHMFFGEERIQVVRQMILADGDEARAEALRKLLPMQRRDFEGIFEAMRGLPVTIRLLDPPLHEFLPIDRQQRKKLAAETGLSERAISERTERLRETNPMLGHRGCRLGVTFPEIYEMQARAIFEAAARVRKKRIQVLPEVMIPLIGTVEEYRYLAERITAVARDVERETKRKLSFQVGTMIEIPRACLVAASIAGEAEFFSFGTNDLTQLTYGYSRDDVAKFLPDYLERRILPRDPFESVDEGGVGRLVQLACEDGRRSNRRLKLGICGEHGGDPDSVRFFHEIGLDYVSCSPYRVAVARLAAAQAALEPRGSGTA